MVVFSHDSLPFRYGENAPVNTLLIDNVPDSTVNIVVDVNGHLVAKTLPYGQKTLVYELRPGNRGQMGLWYRGDKSRPTDLTVSYVKTERPLLAMHDDKEESKDYNQDTTLPSDVVAQEHTPKSDDTALDSAMVHADDSLMKVIDEDTSTAITYERTETREDTIITKETQDLEKSPDIWTAVNEASFEFDRVRLLRNYFTEYGCTKEDVFRALKTLRYDPSRLELCRYLADICKSDLKEWQSDIAETFFVYPHFRREFNDML